MRRALAVQIAPSPACSNSRAQNQHNRRVTRTICVAGPTLEKLVSAAAGFRFIFGPLIEEGLQVA